MIEHKKQQPQQQQPFHFDKLSQICIDTKKIALAQNDDNTHLPRSQSRVTNKYMYICLQCIYICIFVYVCRMLRVHHQLNYLHCETLYNANSRRDSIIITWEGTGNEWILLSIYDDDTGKTNTSTQCD